MLTLTIVTEPIGVLSYGDRVGIYTLLKKINTVSGAELPFASDKMLSYELKRAGRIYHNWRLLDEEIAKKIKSIRDQSGSKKKRGKKEAEEKELFSEEENINASVDYGKLSVEIIKDYEEADLFGFMFPLRNEGALNRNKAVVFDHIISVKPFTGSQNLIHNLDARERYLKHLGEDDKSRQAIVYFEEHRSPYIYTVSIELDRVGREDRSGELAVENSARAKRVLQVLDILEKSFARRVGGRVYPLTPLFMVGGVYEYCVPYFINALGVDYDGNKVSVSFRKSLIPKGLGFVTGARGLGELLEVSGCDDVKSMEDAFSKLRQEVEACYAEAQQTA
ncbi:MAG: type I-B CRISPR-associated protein Cas7/Cst2/DevR [Aquificaceae bacterium]|uniref:type I-B CRISPR-associated protein Cas7/Cst2/DevR n=1 Tax=Hydrogenobacter sp. Uz 6-8 TaxID=3384828 RepID=UPI0030B1D18D